MTRTPSPGAWLFLIAAIAATIIGAVNIFLPDNGITMTFGAWLVTVSSALLALAAWVLGFTGAGRGIKITFAVLTVLGLLGTALAAVMLMSWLHVTAVAVAAIGFLTMGLGASTDRHEVTA